MNDSQAWVLARPDGKAVATVSIDMFRHLGGLRDTKGLPEEPPEELLLAFATSERAAAYLDRCIRYNGRFHGWHVIPVTLAAGYYCECVPLDDGRATLILRWNGNQQDRGHAEVCTSWN
jgi:hypothetical protein